jgi:IS605 OrfB family transposase
VKQTIQVRLLPTPEQASALLETLRVCNEAATWLSSNMRSRRMFQKFGVHKYFYADLRVRFGLAAQPTIRVIGKTVDAYTTLHSNVQAGRYGPPGSRRRLEVGTTPIAFGPGSAQPFDARCLSWQLPVAGSAGTVSIWTVSGRLKGLRLAGSPTQLALLRMSVIGETDLVHRDGLRMLHAVVDETAAALRKPENGFLGVDLGVKNIATTSDSCRMSGSQLNRYRKRQQRIRRRLQAKGTSSARRLLKSRRRKEARFASITNHGISKRIVAKAERTGRGIAVEQLTGIRARVRLRKPQRVMVHSWAFSQLSQYLRYKAERAGVAFVTVDPAYTSQTCCRCGHVDKRNRRSQASFICGRCGFVGHADHDAARNIAERGVAHWGEVMRPHAAPTLAAGQGGSRDPIGKPVVPKTTTRPRQQAHYE